MAEPFAYKMPGRSKGKPFLSLKMLPSININMTSVPTACIPLGQMVFFSEFTRVFSLDWAFFVCTASCKIKFSTLARLGNSTHTCWGVKWNDSDGVNRITFFNSWMCSRSRHNLNILLLSFVKIKRHYKQKALPLDQLPELLPNVELLHFKLTLYKLAWCKLSHYKGRKRWWWGDWKFRTSQISQCHVKEKRDQVLLK